MPAGRRPHLDISLPALRRRRSRRRLSPRRAILCSHRGTAPLSNDTCSVQRIPRDQKLHALAGAKIRTYDDMLTCAVFVQHKNFNGITQVTVIKLIVANAVEAHRRIRRDHEIQRGACWPAIAKWLW